MEFIKYIGTSHRRVITENDFRSVGVNGQGGVEWSYANNFSVARDRLTDDAYAKAIEHDRHFVLVGGDDNAPRNLGTRQTPAQAAGEGRINPGVALGTNDAVSGADASAVTVNDPITTTDVAPSADGSGTGAPTDVESDRVGDDLNATTKSDKRR